MKEVNKIQDLLAIIWKDYGFVEINGRYICETKHNLTQLLVIGWDNNKKKYYLTFEIYKDGERLTGFSVENNCFLPIKKLLFNAIIK